MKKLKVFWNLNNEQQPKLTNTLDFDSWVKLNYLRWLIWIIPAFLISIIITMGVAFGMEESQKQYFLPWIWIIPWIFSVIGILFGFKNQGYVKYLILKYNKRYPKLIDSGSAFFLKDVRWAWKSKTQWYDDTVKQYFHLPEADWIIASFKQPINPKTIKDYLNELNHIFTYDIKESPYDEKKIQGLLVYLKKLASINEVVAALMRYTKKQLNISKNRFNQIISSFIYANQKDLPLIKTSTLPKMPNALNSSPSGAGKTTSVVYNQIIQNATSKDPADMFITDPKGELKDNLSRWFQILGYDVYSFNLKDLHLSMGWNPLSDVFDDVLAMGYLSQILASYQIHNKDEYEQLSKIYNKDVNIANVLSVDEMIKEIKNHNAYDEKNIAFYTNGNFLKQQSLNCIKHTPQKFNQCNCETDFDLYVVYSNTVYAGVDKVVDLYTSQIPTIISSKVNLVLNAIFDEGGKSSDPYWDNSAKGFFETAIWKMIERKIIDVFNNEITVDNFNLFSIYKNVLDRNTFNPNTLGLDFKDENDENKEEKLGWLSTLNIKDNEKDAYSYLYGTNLNSYTIGAKVIKTPEKTRTIIESVVTSKMKSLISEGAKYAMSYNDINFNKMVKSNKPYVIFMGVELQDATYHKLAILFITMLYTKLTWWAEQQPDLKLPRPFNFILDEMGNLPAIPLLANKMTLSRSYRIMLLLIIQSIDQLKLKYKEDMDTIIENAKFKIIRGADDATTAKKWSETIGKTTISSDDNKRGQMRDLITPDEIIDLDYAQRHQTLYFATIFNANEKSYYDDKKQKDSKWIKYSQTSGNYKFIEKQTPWYLLYNTSKFKHFGSIVVETKRYNEKTQTINAKNLNWNLAPFSKLISKENLNTKSMDLNENELFKQVNNTFFYENDEYANSGIEDEEFDNYTYHTNQKEIDDFASVDDSSVGVFNEDQNIKTNNFALLNNLLCKDDYDGLEEDERKEYELINSYSYYNLYKQNQNLKNYAFEDIKTNDELHKVLDAMQTFSYHKNDHNLNNLLNQFSNNVNMNRFSVLVNQILKTNNGYLNPEDFKGTINEQNAIFINSVVRKVCLWLLFGVNSFTNENVFSLLLNTYMNQDPMQRDLKINKDLELKNTHNLITTIYENLKQNEELIKTIIIDGISSLKLDENWNEYMKENFDQKSANWPIEWRNYLYKELLNNVKY